MDISLTWFYVSKVKVILRSNCKCLTYYQQAGGGPSTERHSSCGIILSILLSLCFTSVVSRFRHKTVGCCCDVESCDSGNLSTIPKPQVASRRGKFAHIVELLTVVKIS